MVKRLIGAACALLLMAGVANAAALADNDQFQGQFDGGLSGAGFGVAGHVAGAGAGQLGYGFSVASPGDTAAQWNNQTQNQNDFVSSDDGNGNFSGGGWNLDQTQIQGTIANGGASVAGGAQGAIGGSAGIGAGGTFGIAGSAGAAGAIGGSGAIGGAGAAQYQSQEYTGVYNQQTVGPTSYVYQTGTQNFGTTQGSASALIGAGVSGAGVVQAGGTVAANDGNGGYMEGHGSAVGDAGAFATSGGIAVAGAEAHGTQSHTYVQEAGDGSGNAYQMQTGTVYTDVNAFAID